MEILNKISFFIGLGLSKIIDYLVYSVAIFILIMIAIYV